MKYKVVIFDLDGTLLDTLEDLAAAVNYALSLKGFPPHTLAEYRQMVGHGVRNLVTQALPEEQREETVIDTCLAEFKAYYTAHIDALTRPYPGMQELLRVLHARGVRLAVASNKFQSGTDYLIRRFFGDVPFVAILGNREGYPLKPDPEIVGEVLRRAEADAADAVLVGDSATDMKTAANGGISAIAVTWGYRDIPAEVAPIRATSATELTSLLLSEAPLPSFTS
jgi:phosphoglycolate phosphatase